MLVELKRPPKPRGCCGRKRKSRHSLHDELAGNDDAPTSADDDGEGEAAGCCRRGHAEQTPSEQLLSEQAELREMFENRKMRLDDLVKLMYRLREVHSICTNRTACYIYSMYSVRAIAVCRTYIQLARTRLTHTLYGAGMSLRTRTLRRRRTWVRPTSTCSLATHFLIQI